MSVALSKKGPVLSTDACAPLIALYKAVQEGWDPPTDVSKETYQAAKLFPDTDPMKAFCGFGMSFAGKWFAGYSADRPITRKTGESAGYARFAIQARNLLIKKLNLVNNIQCLDFLSTAPEPTDYLIYCDPPYADTTAYAGGPVFDRNDFICRAQEWSKFTDVFVSEYDFPIGAEIWSQVTDSRVNVKSGSAKKSVERLYHIAKESL
jgi:DNA adenine methylase